MFQGCDNLRRVKLDEGVEIIDYRAFCNFSCNNLKVLSVRCNEIPDHIGYNSPFMLADYELPTCPLISPEILLMLPMLIMKTGQC